MDNIESNPVPYYKIENGAALRLATATVSLWKSAIDEGIDLTLRENRDVLASDLETVMECLRTLNTWFYSPK